MVQQMRENSYEAFGCKLHSMTKKLNQLGRNNSKTRTRQKSGLQNLGSSACVNMPSISERKTHKNKNINKNKILETRMKSKSKYIFGSCNWYEFSPLLCV